MLHDVLLAVGVRHTALKSELDRARIRRLKHSGLHPNASLEDLLGLILETADQLEQRVLGDLVSFALSTLDRLEKVFVTNPAETLEPPWRTSIVRHVESEPCR